MAKITLFTDSQTMERHGGHTSELTDDKAVVESDGPAVEHSEVVLLVDDGLPWRRQVAHKQSNHTQQHQVHSDPQCYTQSPVAPPSLSRLNQEPEVVFL